jgi:hypothetical protein
VQQSLAASANEPATGTPRLAFLLAMAMFVLVVDTSLMNVSISAVVHDLRHDGRGVQAAIALEVLVSAGLSFGLAIAGGVLLATLWSTFTHMTKSSDVIPPAQQQQISDKLEHDAEVVSNTQLQQLVASEPKDMQEEILRINDDATARSLQVALLVPILACLIGLFSPFRMMRLPDIKPSSAVEGASLA